MISFVDGDLFAAHAEAFVNPVNCVGVMGKGLALVFKERFPANFDAYKAACQAGEIRPGRVFIHPEGATDAVRVINFPTKRHWRDRSVLADIETGLDDLASRIVSANIPSVAVPALGCGLGGLDWPPVREAIIDRLGHLDARIIVFPPK